MPRPKWTPFELASSEVRIPPTAELARIGEAFKMTAEAVRDTYLDIAKDTIFVNSLYQVNARYRPGREGWPDMVHLSIKRRDKERVGPERYRDFLRIKNELVGEEHEGIELYPAMSRNVDTANQYHVYVLADPAVKFPFGFNSGRVMLSDSGTSGAKQHPFDDD